MPSALARLEPREESARAGLARLWLARRVADDLHFLHRDERSPGDHLVEDGQELVDVFLVVDHLDDDRQVSREVDEARRVDDARGPEAGDAMKHRRAGEALPAQALEDRPVQRPMAPLVGVADEDADEGLLAVEN